jgi:uncharacterized membrane protein (UPF0182 family)
MSGMAFRIATLKKLWKKEGLMLIMLRSIVNSVKIIIDAYNGSVDFYIVDQEDPIISTYRPRPV